MSKSFLFVLLMFLLILIGFTACKKRTLENMPSPYSTAYFYLPSGFTPNGDIINETFYPVGIPGAITDLNIKIYKRGTCIFDVTGDMTNVTWDGKNSKGKVHKDGKYKVKFSYKDHTGAVHEGTSYVFLINEGKYSQEELAGLIFPDQLHPLYGPVYASNESLVNHNN